MARFGSAGGLDRLLNRHPVRWKEEREVVVLAQPGGRWRGPSERRWVEEIVRGAGFGYASWSVATGQRGRHTAKGAGRTRRHHV